MRVFTLIGASSVLVWSILAAAGCSSDCEDKNACGSGTAATGGAGGLSGDGGTSATGGAGGSSGDAGCDSNASPSQESCLVSDEHAVFVSPTGNDGATGGQGDPLKSITEATNVANAEGKIVVVCNGTYDEHVKITTGAKVYGGFDCSTWAHQSGTRADVVPTTTGYALEVDSVTDAVVIEDIGFKAADGVAPGESSIAGFVKQSTDVTFRRAKLEAGTGVTGANGTLTPYTFPDPLELKGNNADLLAGGAAKSFPTCPGGGSTTGGKGGNGGTPTAGDEGLPDYGGGAGGLGSEAICDVGQIGNAGPAGDDGSATPSVGMISLAGWQGGDGGDGKPGQPGQGGGGGGGDKFGGGGSGAAGGCGGAGASGGKAGGSSIALASFQSTVVLEDSELSSGAGGDGGSSVGGQSGMGLGGNGGQGATAGGCQGGKGGPGGPGGSGAGGAGGASLGVAYKGPKPTLVNTTVSKGAAGNKGIGGTPGVNDGLAGILEDMLEVP